MESFRLLICFAFVVACSMALPAELPAGPQDAPVAPVPVQEDVVGPAREKKQALYPFGYSAYPYTYGAYPYYAGYPTAYSYSHYDDGKYWPGKYEKAYPYKTLYGAYPYNPYYYAY